MRARATAAWAGIGASVVIVLATGCSPGDESPAASTLADAEDVITVAVPPERLSPFCQAISDLDDQLDAAEPGADTTEIIAGAYSAMVDDVPPEIRDDFVSVLAALQSGPVTLTTPSTSPTLPAPPPTSARPSAPPSTAEDFEEGYTPDDDAAQRLNAYIQFACHDGQNNPGPADTQPDAPPVSTTDAP